MAVTFGFYDALNGDRRYNAIQMSSIFDGIINDGVLMGVGDALMVNAGTGLTAIVGKGRAWFNHTWTLNDAYLGLAIDVPDLIYTRIDTVILEVDARQNVRQNSIRLLKGTPAASPVAPTLTNTAWIHQYPLANLSITVGLTQLTASEITNLVGTGSCPFVTGVVQTINITSLVAQWASQFNDWKIDEQADFLAWYNLIKGQLTEDPAGNLQQQIIDLTALCADGWYPESHNWSYSSKDGPIGVISIDNDVSDKLSNGMRVKYSQDQPLTAYWPFDTNSASLVGGWTMGILGSPTYTAGKINNALTLSGTEQGLYVVQDAAFKPTEEFTIGAWIKTSNAGNQSVFSSGMGDDGKLDNGVNLGINAGLPYFESGANSNIKKIIGKVAINDGNWHHLVLVYRQHYAQLYVDGKVHARGWMPTPVYDDTQGPKIGCLYQWTGGGGGYTNWFNGQIDDLFFISGYGLDENFISKKYLLGNALGSSALSLEKMGIVVNVGPYSGGNTLVSIYHGNDYNLANSSISFPKISSTKTPKGFNSKPYKWSVIVEYMDLIAAITPSANWSPSGLSIVIPIGCWIVQTNYKMTGSLSSGSAGVDVWGTLGPTNGSEDPQFTVETFNGGQTIYNSVYKTGLIETQQKTTHYVNLKSESLTNLSSIGIDVPAGGLDRSTSLIAKCAYL